jgi:hypothetical protein
VKTAIVHGHVVDTPARQLSDDDSNSITAALAEQGIRVAPSMDAFLVVHLWALTELTTAQEVAALAMFAAATDCRLAWHRMVADV